MNDEASAMKPEPMSNYVTSYQIEQNPVASELAYILPPIFFGLVVVMSLIWSQRRREPKALLLAASALCLTAGTLGSALGSCSFTQSSYLAYKVTSMILPAEPWLISMGSLLLAGFAATNTLKRN